MSDAVAPRDPADFPPGFAQAVGLTQVALADLATFRGMLAAANAETNLVGRSTLGDFWSRHFIDSAQLRCFAPRALVWADLGTGAGLPGIVLSILLKGVPGAKVHLVETRTKRCQFVADVVASLDLPAKIHHARAEDVEVNVDIVTARACAPLDRLLLFAQPYFQRGARALFLKGAEVQKEILQAKSVWRFEERLHNSLSDGRGYVLQIDSLTPKRSR
jgi:16S rRNA (guanine527-N7)-methyltransferase